ncbi:MAG: cupin domain-containing protein [Myxococcota bacterium]
MLQGNVFTAIPTATPEEFSESLVGRRGVKFERIVSRGHASPPDFWYDQEQHEFVFVVSGRAVLDFDDGRRLELSAGDWVQIDAHVRHRVNWTDPEVDTIWLVAFFDV